jgi:hypothetical protein
MLVKKVSICPRVHMKISADRLSLRFKRKQWACELQRCILEIRNNCLKLIQKESLVRGRLGLYNQFSWLISNILLYIYRQLLVCAICMSYRIRKIQKLTGIKFQNKLVKNIKFLLIILYIKWFPRFWVIINFYWVINMVL